MRQEPLQNWTLRHRVLPAPFALSKQWRAERQRMGAAGKQDCGAGTEVPAELLNTKGFPAHEKHFKSSLAWPVSFSLLKLFKNFPCLIWTQWPCSGKQCFSLELRSSFGCGEAFSEKKSVSSLAGSPSPPQREGAAGWGAGQCKQLGQEKNQGREWDPEVKARIQDPGLSKTRIKTASIL